jgi:hypothetical protein
MIPALGENAGPFKRKINVNSTLEPRQQMALPASQTKTRAIQLFAA